LLALMIIEKCHPDALEGRQWVVMTDPEGNEFCISQ
tara:strand:- start:6505 stop:6612 length:108 start_codon:yes stop_codon:yes gene_type:complete